MIVALLNTSLSRFFAISLAIHSLLFLLVHPAPPFKSPRQETIPVSLLPPADQDQPAPTPIPRVPATRRSKEPTTIARKDSPVPREKSAPLQNKAENPSSLRAETLPASAPSPPPAPAPREPVPENSVIVERQLPSLKELLPPTNWSSSNSRSNSPVSLNTRDPVYVSYFNKIKQSIESHWEYPEVALRYGLQGRLSLEFSVAGNGQLEQLRILRSSGSQVLDEEAVRAIKAAAPFPPIPPWIRANPLLISASMEYHDNRLDYRFNR
jgi:protein TonB